MEYRYYSGIDPNQGGIGRTAPGGNKTTRDADDFAMSVWRVEDQRSPGPAELVKMIRGIGLTARQMSAVIHREHSLFNFEIVVMDPNGGGLSVRDHLREPMQDDGAEKFQVTPLITLDDTQMQGAGDPRLVLFGRSDSRIKRVMVSMPSESYPINKAHEIFRGALEGTPQRVRFPTRWDGWAGRNQFSSSDQMRAHIDAQHGLTGRARAAAEIDLALFQLITVDRRMETDGVRVYQDKHGMYEFLSTCKKDSAYAMVYGYFALWIASEERRIAEQSTGQEPEFVISVQQA